jgi:hypothetical protein
MLSWDEYEEDRSRAAHDAAVTLRLESVEMPPVAKERAPAGPRPLRL